MGLTKQQKQKNSLIQKEQQQLLKIQNELASVLFKVNEGINVLKVEELQLKSSAVLFEKHIKRESDQPAQLDLKPSVSHRQTKEIPENTKLNLDLNIHKEIEYEDDDDEI